MPGTDAAVYRRDSCATTAGPFPDAGAREVAVFRATASPQRFVVELGPDTLGARPTPMPAAANFEVRTPKGGPSCGDGVDLVVGEPVLDRLEGAGVNHERWYRLQGGALHTLTVSGLDAAADVQMDLYDGCPPGLALASGTVLSVDMGQIYYVRVHSPTDVPFVLVLN
jgi:hypothetical protein